MKRVRIMLAAMVVLGSVGGALALKAKKFGGSTYCITTLGTIGDICPLLLQHATFRSGGIICYKKVPPNTNCVTVTCTGIGLSGL